LFGASLKLTDGLIVLPLSLIVVDRS
jgi:hypothetical protein